MGYIESNLMADERVLHQAKLHWVVFLWPAIWFIVAIIFFSGQGKDDTAGAWCLLISFITGAAEIINYTTSEFGLTNKRVIAKVGFIRRNSIEVLLTKVEGINVSQGIMGRILGFGSITISGTGGTKDPFHKIRAPLEFRKKVQEQIAVVQDSK